MINKIFPFFYMALFGIQMYSIVGWIVTLIIDRQNLKRRKKYANLCLAVIVIMAVVLVVSLAMNIKRNTM